MSARWPARLGHRTLGVDLPSAADYFGTPEGSTNALLDPDFRRGEIGDPAKLGAIGTNWRSADPAFRVIPLALQDRMIREADALTPGALAAVLAMRRPGP